MLIKHIFFLALATWLTKGSNLFRHTKGNIFRHTRCITHTTKYHQMLTNISNTMSDRAEIAFNNWLEDYGSTILPQVADVWIVWVLKHNINAVSGPMYLVVCIFWFHLQSFRQVLSRNLKIIIKLHNIQNLMKKTIRRREEVVPEQPVNALHEQSVVVMQPWIHFVKNRRLQHILCHTVATD